MSPIGTLLAPLTRSDVSEIRLVSGKRPAIRLGGGARLEEIPGDAISGDDLLRILFGAGGSRYVESLGPKPAQWRTRIDGIGVVVVNATQRGDAIEAWFVLREPAPGARATPAGRTPAAAPQPPAPAQRITRPAVPFKGLQEGGRSWTAAVPTPRAPPAAPPQEEDDDGDRPSSLPTPPRGFEVPRAALPSILDVEIDLDTEIPSVPRGRAPAPPPPPPPPPPAPARAPSVAPDPERRRVSGAGRTTRPFARDGHTPLFRSLLAAARDAGASDVHLVAGRPALLRVAGQVTPRGEPIDPQVVEDMVLCRVPRRLEEAFAREGSCDFAVEEPELGRFRVNASRQRTGVKASIRVISREVPTLAQLGLPAGIAAATRHHQGLIVLTGPTGHGKTTTLAALVDILNSESTRHVITVEDPIEHVHPRKRALLSQREVGTHTKSFQAALKAALREDPDVIVVGELRDTETVRIALTASETGHLVLGTMSTPSAARAIDRLVDLFPPADQQQVRMTLAGGLRLIVGQRLVPDMEGKAMVAAAEVLPGMIQLWNLIRENRTYQIPSLQQRGRELGVVRLDDSLRDLVRTGRTTAQKAVAMAEAPEELELALGLRRPSVGAMPRPPGSTMGLRPGDPGSAPYPGSDAGAGQPPRTATSTSSPGFAAQRPPEPAPSKGLFDFFKKGG